MSESIQLGWNLSNYVGICPITLESVSCYSLGTLFSGDHQWICPTKLESVHQGCKNSQVPKSLSRKMTSWKYFQEGWQRLQSWCDCSNRIWNDSKRVGNAFGYFHKSWLPRRKPSRDLAKKEIGNASNTVGNESKRVENESKRVGNESNIVGNAFEWFSKKFTSPKVVARKMLHKKVGNDYNHDGIVPIRLEDYPISIYPTALEYVLLSTLESVQLRWNTIQDEHFQLR